MGKESFAEEKAQVLCTPGDQRPTETPLPSGWNQAEDASTPLSISSRVLNWPILTAHTEGLGAWVLKTKTP